MNTGERREGDKGTKDIKKRKKGVRDESTIEIITHWILTAFSISY
jgi:hypothetical protein